MKRAAIAMCVILLAVAGAIAWRLRPERVHWATDAGAIREPLATARIREILWKPPTTMPAMPRAVADIYEPRITADGRTLYFVHGKPGANADIFVCRRSRAGWGPPEPLAAINSEFDDLGPEPAPDGQALYFYSDRPGGASGYDLWMSRLGENGWEPPANLGAFINSPYNDYGPALSPDGRMLCFSSNRPASPAEAPKEGAWQATIREDLYQHDYDLYAVSLEEGAAPRVEPLTSLNSSAHEGAPAFSPVGDFFYFSSDRSDGFGAFDLYRARRVAGAFQAPENLGGTINSPANELDPALSMGGYHLLFSSDRPTDRVAPSPSASTPPRRYALYESQSREVFRDVEFRPVAFDWPGLWRQVGPNLLWAILALIVSLLLITLLRDLRGGRLSLLARCLLASLLIHTLLMLLFNVVEVTTAVASALRRSDRVRVTLASVSNGDSLARQIRGNLSEALAIQPVALAEPDRPAPPPVLVEPRADQLPIDATAARPSDRPIAELNASASPDRPPELPAPTFTPPSPSLLASLVETPSETPQAHASEAPLAVSIKESPAATARLDLLIPTSQPSVDAARVALEPATANTPVSTEDVRLTAAPAPQPAPTPSMHQAVALQSQPPPPLSATTRDLAVPTAIEPARQATLDSTALASRSLEAASRSASTTNAPRAALAVPAIAPSSHESISLPPAASPLAPPREASLAVQSPASMDADSAPAPSIAAPGRDLAPAHQLVAVDLAAPADLPASTRSNSAKPGPFETPLALGSLADRTSRATASPGQRPSLPVAPAAAAPVVQLAPAAEASSASDQPLAHAPFATINDLARPTGTPAIPAPIGAESPPALRTTALDLALPMETEPPPTLAAVVAAPSTPDEGVVGRPVAGRPEGPAPRTIGAIIGRVTSARTGEPIFGAEIRLDLPDSPSVVAATGRAGRYELHAPRMPDFFAVSATAEGFTPESANVAARAMTGTTLTLDFTLRPISEHVIALEDDPPVHHLGNDLFEGRINSQFQRDSEGKFFAAKFRLARHQVAPRIRRGEITLLAKGVQCPHKLRLNGQTLDPRLDASPSDGSFGEMTIAFDPALLHEGENAFVLRAVFCRGDLDDFEFVNVRIRLYP